MIEICGQFNAFSGELQTNTMLAGESSAARSIPSSRPFSLRTHIIILTRARQDII